MADPLHQCRAAALGKFVDQRVARFAILGRDLHLDQFVVFERLADFSHHRIGHALAADLQHGLEVMRLATKETVLGRGQDDRHAGQGRKEGVQGIMATRKALISGHFDRLPCMATRSKSSQRWLKEHFSDPYVKKAQAEGLRSRAAYKLEELVERDRLLKPGMVVVDLGAAPGGWSQWVRQALGDSGRVIALDILEMPGLAGVEFLHGDFREDAVLLQLEAALDGKGVDLVLSDMAPNKSGVDAVDLPRAMHLAELAMDFADRHLRADGVLLIKLFQGVGFDDYVRELRRRYAKVVIRKPAASRKRSPEVYALAQGKLAQMK
jgi:23S rRNA (uridine2552-2'-O)-methyltransferase